jgi:hypothetical protein
MLFKLTEPGERPDPVAPKDEQGQPKIVTIDEEDKLEEVESDDFINNVTADEVEEWTSEEDEPIS